VGVQGGAVALAQLCRPMYGGGGSVPALSESASRGHRGHGRPAPDLYVVLPRRKEISPLL
jgi:hypothetical protein